VLGNMTTPSCDYKILPTHEKNNYTGRPSLIYTKEKLKSTNFVSRHYISNCGWHTSDSYYPAPPEKLPINCICDYLYEEGGGGGGMEDLAMPIQAITATPSTIHPPKYIILEVIFLLLSLHTTINIALQTKPF